MTDQTVLPNQTDWPVFRPLGVDGIVITFGSETTAQVSRAVLACCNMIAGARLPAVAEISPALVSVLVRFDPMGVGYDALCAQLSEIIDAGQAVEAAQSCPRHLWHVPAAFGGRDGPQLSEAAALAGLTPDQAIASIAAQTLRVLAIGFAPGQPYLGHLDRAWHIPRQTALTRHVPQGALCVALSQVVAFARPGPTGWRQVGRMAMPLFQPDAAQPFLLSPGDLIVFEPATADHLADLAAAHPLGGARCVVV